MATRHYPIGIQAFEKIRRDGNLYIDKTEYIYRMSHVSGKYFFLNRPRRFGKSLLVSTMQSYFEGKKELFKGLAMEHLEQEWTEYPVLHFDMSLGKHLEKTQLEQYLGHILAEQEVKYGISSPETAPNLRLATLIQAAYRQTGKQVVVLIDEYDAPLLDVVHETEQLEALRYTMQNFYSPLKACDPYLRFVFLTGITKFSQLSIFSELNNISNISMLPEYGGICGITLDEIETQMVEDVDILGKRLGLNHEQTMEALRSNYDGYHFSWPSADVFNPFSLLSALAYGNLDAYWFSSGTPTFLLQMMRKFDVYPSQLGAMKAMKTDFDAPTEHMESLTPLLYQSGYLTIKDYDRDFEVYTLDIPNREIRVGLFRSLLPKYVSGTKAQQGGVTIANMARFIRNDDMDGALRLLQDFLGTVPYCHIKNYEGHYQQMLFIIFTLLTRYMVDVEVHTSCGRVDIVMQTPTHLYIIELKLNQDAQTALRQINLKDYRSRFALCGLPVVKVGINFDSEKGNITDWLINA